MRCIFIWVQSLLAFYPKAAGQAECLTEKKSVTEDFKIRYRGGCLMLSFASGMNCLRQQNKLRRQGRVSLLYQGRKHRDSQSPGQIISHKN